MNHRYEQMNCNSSGIAIEEHVLIIRPGKYLEI